jgi:ribosomal protein S18 acetylase RimI-like enzyme/heme-degrading monooxygenase HmoA
MLLILFRSKLPDQAGADYAALDAELESLVKENPGFIRAKSYAAQDGERLTVVWWRDEESLHQWRNLARHGEAQRTGQQRWYRHYEMEVATVMRSISFERERADSASAPASIRPAIGEDIPGILACLGFAFEPYRHLYTPDAFLDTVLTPGTLSDRLRNMQIFVAADSTGQIVGTIACSSVGAQEGHLRGMAVLADWRGNGLAAQLLDRAQAELRRQGCARITLDTTEPLERAMRFYEKHGFRRSGKITDFFGMRLIEYEITLDAHSPRAAHSVFR